MKNIVSCKRFFYAVSLIFVFFVSGCTNSDKVDPDEVIKEFGQDAQQLAMVEIEDRQLRLMTYDDQYELVEFRKEGDAYRYDGGYITQKPYIQRCETNDAGVYVTVVIDNTMIEADEYTLEMRASETDSMLLKAENLLGNEPYLIKVYHLPGEYQTMEPMTFYDENFRTAEVGHSWTENISGTADAVIKCASWQERSSKARKGQTLLSLTTSDPEHRLTTDHVGGYFFADGQCDTSWQRMRFY